MSSPTPPSDGSGQDESQRPAAPDQSAGQPPTDETSAPGQTSWSQPSTQPPAQPYGQGQGQSAPPPDPQNGGQPPPPPPPPYSGQQPPPAYGQQPPTYSQQPPPSFGSQQPPSYGQQPPPYGQQPPPGQYPADPDPYGQQAPAPWTPAGQGGYPAAPYPGAPVAPIVNPYASWGQRVGSYLLDALLVLPFAIVGTILVVIGAAGASAQVTYDANGYPTTTTSGFSALALIGYLIYLFGGIGITAWNRWYKAGKTGQSWGRKMMGLKLVRASDGQPIGGWMAFLRDIAHYVDSLICYVGWFFPLWDQKRQTIADKIVSTVVFPGVPKG